MALAGMLLIVAAGLASTLLRSPAPADAAKPTFGKLTMHDPSHPDLRRRTAARCWPQRHALRAARLRLRPGRPGGRRARLAAGPPAGRALRAPGPRPVRRQDRPQRPPPAARAPRRWPNAPGGWGIAPGVQVVCYDAPGRALCGARLVDAALAGPRRRGRCSTAASPPGRPPAARSTDEIAAAAAAAALPGAAAGHADAAGRRTAGRSSAACAWCSTRAPASASAARSSRWTRWPATSPAR